MTKTPAVVVIDSWEWLAVTTGSHRLCLQGVFIKRKERRISKDSPLP
ncbi:MAG: hypothetical protein WCO51_09105 [bacterium]